MLKSLFLKNNRISNSPKVRIKYGIYASLYGIISNIFVFIATFSIGLISGSVALMSEAINGLSDAISSCVALVGFKISSKPADKEHPFGYARFEYISALIISFIICIIGAFLCKSSIDKIISPGEIDVTFLMIIVLIVSAGFKISQYAIYKKIGEAIDSETLNANKIDTRNDLIVTLLTLIALVIMRIFKINIDAYVGFAVSLFTIISGFKVLLDAISPLIGEKPNKEMVEKIKKKLNSYDGVISFHELIVHSYGKGTNFVSVHIEVSADVNPTVAHELVDRIEEDFLKDLKIHLVVHMDPIQSKNDEINKLKSKIQDIIQTLNKNLVVNDFRAVEKKKYVYVMFDCTVPYETGLTKTKIIKFLKSNLSEESKIYKIQINIERDFV